MKRIVLLVVCLPLVCSVTSSPKLFAERATLIDLPGEVSLNEGAGQGDALYLTLRLNEGQELLFMVDTGSDGTILDQSLAPQLGEQLEQTILNDSSTGRKLTVRKYLAPRLWLENTRLVTGISVVTLDLSHIRGALGRPVMGILGMDCLENYCIQLDFDDGKIRFLNPAQSCSEGLGTEFSLQITSAGRYVVRWNLLGLDGVDSEIDTGETFTGRLEPKLFGAAMKGGEVSPAGTGALRFSGVHATRIGRLSKCVFGKETYRDLVLDESQPTAIGLRFLARHLVTLNYPRMKMYLKRRTEAFPVDEDDMSGLSLAKRGEAIVVKSVDKGGCADHAGLQAGDVVQKVNGRPVDTMELWELRKLFQSGGDEVGVTVQRGSELKQLTFVLKRRI